MLLFALTVLCTVVLASAVVVYVAFPHRGHEVPNAPWLGTVMRRGVASLPTLDNQAGQEERGDARRVDQGTSR